MAGKFAKFGFSRSNVPIEIARVLDSLQASVSTLTDDSGGKIKDLKTLNRRYVQDIESRISKLERDIVDLTIRVENLEA